MKRVPLETLLGYERSRLHRAALKLTHVGEQTVPVLTVVIACYFHLPSLDAFRPLRHTGLSYANDELPNVLHFSVAPQELRMLLAAAHRVCSASAIPGGVPSLAFAAVADAPDGPEGDESILSLQQAGELYRHLESALSPENGTGRAVLEMQRDAGYPRCGGVVSP
jgi:hypothetical protein